MLTARFSSSSTFPIFQDASHLWCLLCPAAYLLVPFPDQTLWQQQWNVSDLFWDRKSTGSYHGFRVSSDVQVVAFLPEMFHPLSTHDGHPHRHGILKHTAAPLELYKGEASSLFSFPSIKLKNNPVAVWISASVYLSSKLLCSTGTVFTLYQSTLLLVRWPNDSYRYPSECSNHSGGESVVLLGTASFSSHLLEHQSLALISWIIDLAQHSISVVSQPGMAARLYMNQGVGVARWFMNQGWWLGCIWTRGGGCWGG